ncbi:hypothetical protein ScPMuIL_006494 [Solemya velum]
MGNTNEKLPLRKTVSVPESQFLTSNPDLRRNKSRSTLKLFRRKSEDDLDKLSDDYDGKLQSPVPLAQALFLPDFPVRGDIEAQDFVVMDVIAKGAYGNVLKVRREDAKQYYALKVLNKTQIIVERANQQVKDEAAIQTMLGDHPFIVKSHEYWQSRRYLYIVLDYVPHGDMFTLWTFHGFFPDKLVGVYIAEMAMVLDYLHNSGVIYRDIKMENMLFDPTGHIQLTDFGLAKWLQKGEKTRTVCGTLQYMAPEVLAVYPYGHTADWWSMGILMYAMLAGKYPVEGAKNHVEMGQKVYDSDFLLPPHVCDAAQDVLLTKNPQKRLTDLQSLQTCDFYKNFDLTALTERKISPRDVVPPDFFPMSGVRYSYAPEVFAPENGSFSEFDFVWNLPPGAEPVYV